MRQACLRFVWGFASTAGVVALALALIACDAFNPALINRLTGNVIPAVDVSEGDIITVLVNLTPFEADVRSEVRRPGVISVQRLSTGPISAFPTVEQCPVQAISITEATVLVPDEQGNIQEQQVDIPDVDLTGGSNLQCGNIVVYGVSGTTQETFRLAVQIR